MAWAAVVKSVGYSGYACFGRYVHWVQTPAMAMSSACGRPSSSSAIRLAAYDTDSVDPLLVGIGRFTFHSEVRQVVARRTRKRSSWGYVRGNRTATSHVPARMTAAT